MLNWDTDLANSPIWDKEMRDKASESSIKDYEVQQARKGFVVSQPYSVKNIPIIPILLIQQPGCRKGDFKILKSKFSHFIIKGFGAGWDVIVPEKWGMAFWRSLIMRGARAGGLQELSQLFLEMQDTFSMEQIDHIPPEQYTAMSNSLTDAYLALPPSKRANFVKLGFREPFGFPWMPMSTPVHFNIPYVLREPELLNSFNTALKKGESVPIGTLLNALFVPVWLYCEKGRLHRMARIYLPEDEDCGDVFELKEGDHGDPMQEDRKLAAKTHRKCLNILRKQRKNKERNDKVLEQERKKLLENYKQIQKELVFDVDSFVLRDEIGIVLNSSFSYSLGCYVAFGYISCDFLTDAINLNAKFGTNFLLVKNITHYQYARCRFSLIND